GGGAGVDRDAGRVVCDAERRFGGWVGDRGDIAERWRRVSRVPVDTRGGDAGTGRLWGVHSERGDGGVGRWDGDRGNGDGSAGAGAVPLGGGRGLSFAGRDAADGCDAGGDVARWGRDGAQQGD